MARYSVNKAILVGNLGREPEVRYTPDGKAVANFSLATSRSRQDAKGDWIQETEWHRVICWERHAETAGEHLHKGSKVYVEGRIQSRKYTDNDGIERTVYEIIAGDLTLLDRAESSGDYEGGRAPRRSSQPRPQTAEGSAGDNWGDEEFEDVPF